MPSAESQGFMIFPGRRGSWAHLCGRAALVAHGAQSSTPHMAPHCPPGEHRVRDLPRSLLPISTGTGHLGGCELHGESDFSHFHELCAHTLQKVLEDRWAGLRKLRAWGCDPHLAREVTCRLVGTVPPILQKQGLQESVEGSRDKADRSEVDCCRLEEEGLFEKLGTARSQFCPEPS